MADEKTLAELVATADRQVLVDDCVQLVDEEVKNKGGLSGIAIKGAYGTVKAVKPGFVPEVIDGMLDDWIARLSPHFDAWRKAGSGGAFSAYVEGRADAVAEDLLAVTDDRASNTKHKTVKKLYDKLRPSAKRNVSEAAPRLGALVEKHARAK